MVMIIRKNEFSTRSESGHHQYHAKLITEGMCQKIKDNGIKMVFIGIGYVPDNNIIDWEKDCVGTGNFYLAKNAHELEISIERALVVDDEVGRNIPKS